LTTLDEELGDVYINRPLGSGNALASPVSGAAGKNASVTAEDLIWDWSSKPNLPAK